MSDREASLIDAVRQARAAARPVVIAGTGSKAFLTRAPGSIGGADGRLLSTEEHSGIVDYRPDELVVTARAGTPLKALRQILAHEGQMLAFEPPEFQGLGTLGGAVASGLAGPGRACLGGVRDAVLGVEMVNGLGERLSFGGQVMKNVAGFDVARLQAGAFGIFGLLLSVSLKVQPVPQRELTRVLELDPASALARMRAWAAGPLPVTATAWHDGRLRVRLAGAEPSVLAAARLVGGETDDDGFWTGLRDHGQAFFRAEGLACRHVPPATAVAAEDQLIEWGGARRWTAADETDPALGFQPFGAGYARHRCGDAGGDARLAGYQQRLKQAFDPDDLFNPELTRADVAA